MKNDLSIYGDDDLRSLLSAREAADFLNVQPQTLAKWRTVGGECAIPYVKVGRSIRYRRSALEQYIEANTYMNTTEAIQAQAKLSQSGQCVGK